MSQQKRNKKNICSDPVDSNLFNPGPIPSVNSGDSLQAEAVTMDTEVTNMPWVHNYLKINNINFDIDVYDRIKHPLMYIRVTWIFEALQDICGY